MKSSGYLKNDVGEVNLLIMPNPSKLEEEIILRLIGFSASEATITIYNMHGATLFNQTIQPSNNEIKLDYHFITPGPYSLIIKTIEGVFVYKIIKI
jgi:hypothetical protein